MGLTDEILGTSKTVGPPAGEEGYDKIWDRLDGEWGMRHFDREGRPISMRDYVRLLEWNEGAYKRIEETTIGSYWVSTVWLGLNHAFDEGPPMIFETMVFPQEDGVISDWADLEVARYTTESEARVGHAEMVERVSLLWEATKGVPRMS